MIKQNFVSPWVILISFVLAVVVALPPAVIPAEILPFAVVDELPFVTSPDGYILMYYFVAKSDGFEVWAKRIPDGTEFCLTPLM